MLKGHVFENQLFGNPIFAVFVNTFLAGENGVINGFGNGMAVTTNGFNLTVQSGVCCVQGRFLQEDTSTTITAGSTPAYARLVIEIDLDKVNTENDFQQGYYKVITNSGTYPNLTQTDIVNNVSGVYQFPLGRFQITPNGVTNYADERAYLDFDSIYEEIREKILDIESESIYTIKGEKLWENPNPTQDFAPQTIDFGEVNNYDFYRIKYKPFREYTSYLYQDIEPSEGNFTFYSITQYTPGYANPNTKGHMSVQVRDNCTCDNRSVTFTYAVHYLSNQNTKDVNDNQYMIPIAIYGYNL